MTIARGTAGKKQFLILGLSGENIGRLTKGEHILLARETHGEGIPADWQIAIVFGQTEQAIADELKQLGLVNEQTKVHYSPRL